MSRILLGALGMLSGLGFTATATLSPARRTFKNLRPVGAALRDRTEFYQSNALEASVMKRRRRAKKLDTWAFLSADNNRAHYDEFDNLHDRLNPFYVAK